MSIAANLSGRAISISKTTAPHALSYPFTAYYNISHGHAVSLTLNQCLKFNFENIDYTQSNFDLKKRFNIIFKLANVKNIFELDKYLSHIKKKAGLESNFKQAKNYTIAPKIGYGVALLFLNARLSVLNYFQNDKSEFRVLPEIGLSLGGKINMTYGYGIAFKDNNLNNVSNHRLSINFLLF